jgi:hypothetical protein
VLFPPRLANLVNLESALSGSAADSAIALGRSFGIGVAVVGGGVTEVAWRWFLRMMHSTEHAYPVTLA